MHGYRHERGPCGAGEPWWRRWSAATSLRTLQQRTAGVGITTRNAALAGVPHASHAQAVAHRRPGSLESNRVAPPTKPIEAKRRAGTLRKDRMPRGALTIIAPASPSLEPPAMLGDVGAAEWRHILRTCVWIAPSDLTHLRLYCLALDRHSALLALLAEQGTVLYTDKGYAYLNPAQGALATTEAQITKWQSLLGVTPSDRSRLGVAEVKAHTKLEELEYRRAARDGRPAS